MKGFIEDASIVLHSQSGLNVDRQRTHFCELTLFNQECFLLHGSHHLETRIAHSTNPGQAGECSIESWEAFMAHAWVIYKLIVFFKATIINSIDDSLLRSLLVGPSFRFHLSSGALPRTHASAKLVQPTPPNMETTTIMSIPTAHEDLSSKNVATPDDAGLAFLALARDLEPYLDDFTRQSTFKNFLDLPNELQYHVYEDYLCDNASALATAYMDPFSRDDVDYQDEGMAAGRYLYWDDILDDETWKKRSSAPFLPLYVPSVRTS